MKKRVLLVVGGIVAAVAATVIIVLATRGGDTDAASGNRVKIELRGKPVATLQMNGHPIGTTPKTIVLPRGTAPVELEATFKISKINPIAGRKKIETWRQVKSIVPDAEQSVDFRIEDAIKVDERIEEAKPPQR